MRLIWFRRRRTVPAAAETRPDFSAEVTRELAVRWVMTVNRSGCRNGMRGLVSAAAMIQARMPCGTSNTGRT
jgi:hypothetical protein